MAELGTDFLAASALSGVGAGLLSYGLARVRARAARARRLAHVVGITDTGSPASARFTPRARVRLSAFVQDLRHLARVHATLGTRAAASIGLTAGMTGLMTGNPAWFLLVLVGVGLIVWLRRQTDARRKLELQAASVFEILASGLRAGYSVPQAIALVARESPQPSAAEFALAERELALGSSLTESLANLAERTGLPDYKLVSIVIWIQSEVGGNLPLVLDSVVKTLRERFDLREQVLALTAQQRMASTVLSLLPVGVLGLFLAVDRAFVAPMFDQPTGRIMLGVAALLLSVGWAAMHALSRVEL